MPQGLSGKTAIVTGAGGGVGRAIARRLDAAGARVMMADADEASLAETAEEMEGETAHFSCKLDEKLSVNNLLAATQDSFGAVDILVNAGPKSLPGSFLDLPAPDFEASASGNLRAVFLLSQAVAKRMVEAGEADSEFQGAIVNITSIAAQRTIPELFAYSVACAALDQLTRSMAACLAPHRIRVNGVALGSVMSRNMRMALKERMELREDLIRVTPLGRIGETHEAAEAAVFLASDAASFITGQILGVDGGRLVLDPLDSPEE